MVNDTRCGMNTYEQALNLVWILLGAAVCAYSFGLNIMVASKPGSGLVPFLAGAIIGLAGLARFGAGLRAGGVDGVAFHFWATAAYRNRTLLVLVGFCAMAFLMPKLGFLLSAVLVTTFLLYVIEPRHPLKILCTAAVTCLIVYGLFVVLLRVNLPRGILGY
jgi:putative tricarboxylic transport membrane protein